MSQRTYLLHGTYAEYYAKKGEPARALVAIDKAISICTNSLEREYLKDKKARMQTNNPLV
jgi:predicted RNA polymerase sigma factor